MEELQNKNHRLIMRRTQLDPSAMTSMGTANEKFIQKQSMLAQSQQNILNEVFECIRDASSTENARAIQDSESSTAQEQKKIIKTLLKKGWSKNEIVYEVQRLYGNDVLILKNKLDDQRGPIGKYGMPFFLVTALSTAVFLRRRRMIQAQRAAYQAAELQAAQARAKAEAEKIDKDELLRKLNMKK